MEVMIPYNEKDNFDFNSARSTPFTSPPATPKPFNGEFYFSAPPSPTHLSQFYREFESLFVADGDDDDKDKGEISSHVDEFAFDVGQELETGSVSAEDLFDGGMIKPSPVMEVRKKRIGFSSTNKQVEEAEQQRESRGKQRGSLSNSSSRRSARSLSPMRRTSQYLWQEEEVEEEEENGEMKKQSCSLLSSSSSSKGSKKWRFKDLFLFRSASEGRASDKDPLKKYTVAGYREGKYSSIKGNNETSSSSSKSSSKSIVTSRTTKRGKVSAHELHYTVNRAVSSDLKKKTFLPYKQGILGQLAFNPAVHALANGFGLSKK
ncbi:hypothetical protein P3S68_026959 [Capsicum galapagoense]